MKKSFLTSLGLCLAVSPGFSYGLLQDNFEGASLNHNLWTSGGQWSPSITLSNGVITLSNQGNSHYSRIRTVDGSFDFHEASHAVTIDIGAFGAPDWTNAGHPWTNHELWFTLGPADIRDHVQSSNSSVSGFAFALSWRRDEGLRLQTNANVGIPHSTLAAVPAKVRITLNATEYSLELLDGGEGSIFTNTGAHGITNLSSYHFMVFTQMGAWSEPFPRLGGSIKSITIERETPPPPPPGRWAGFELTDNIAETDDWLGRVHVLGGNWVYIEKFDEVFFALPVELGGVWLYSPKEFVFEDGFLDTDRWFGHINANGNRIYSFKLETWFFMYSAEPHSGNWFYWLRDYPKIPSERLFAWDAGVRGGIPHYPVAIELSIEDLPTGEASNAAPIIQAAINTVGNSGNFGAVLLPEGTFYLTQGITMRSGVVLRGQGLDKTKLIMDAPQSNWHGIINFQGSGLSSERAIVAGYETGSTTLQLASMGGITPGRVVFLQSDNDLDAMYGNNETWLEAGTTWAQRSVGQVVKVVEVIGNTVVIDTPVRLSRMHLNPTLSVMTMLQYAGVESLHMSWKGVATDFNVLFARAENCWVLDCELDMTNLAHVQMMHSRHNTIESNYIHHAHSYGGGGRGYGVALGHGSSDNLIWNNVFRVLRHAMLTGGGANGNVWAYNYSREQHQEGGGWGCDFSVHGHYPYMELYEGNRGEYAMSTDWWGAAGPLVTFFRNRLDPSTHSTGAAGTFRIQYGSHFQNAIGNSLVVGQTMFVGSDIQEPYIEGNFIRERIEWNESEPFPLPASVFLSGPPHFWGDAPWPAIGADVDYRAFVAEEDFLRIPAQVWGERILSEGRSMPFSQRVSD